MWKNSAWTFGANGRRLHSIQCEATTILSAQAAPFARVVPVANKRLIRIFTGVPVSHLKAGAVRPFFAERTMSGPGAKLGQSPVSKASRVHIYVE